MKTWIEYSANIENYYEWILSQNNNILKKMSVLSFNATGIEKNINEFYQYCTQEVCKALKYPETYNVYIIVNERIKNINSKVEHYKKCWKKIGSEFDISKFELGDEMEYEYNGQFFYAGIAKTSIINMIDVMRIVNANPNKCIVFASKENYFVKSYMNKKFLDLYIAYNRYGDIDYTKCFVQCSLNHDLGIRYGTSFSEAELALVLNFYDCDTVLNPAIIKAVYSEDISQ